VFFLEMAGDGAKLRESWARLWLAGRVLVTPFMLAS
jgi:hypothetical protein